MGNYVTYEREEEEQQEVVEEKKDCLYCESEGDHSTAQCEALKAVECAWHQAKLTSRAAQKKLWGTEATIHTVQTLPRGGLMLRAKSAHLGEDRRFFYYGKSHLETGPAKIYIYAVEDQRPAQMAHFFVSKIASVPNKLDLLY